MFRNTRLNRGYFIANLGMEWSFCTDSVGYVLPWNVNIEYDMYLLYGDDLV